MLIDDFGAWAESLGYGFARDGDRWAVRDGRVEISVGQGTLRDGRDCISVGGTDRRGGFSGEQGPYTTVGSAEDAVRRLAERYGIERRGFQPTLF